MHGKLAGKTAMVEQKTMRTARGVQPESQVQRTSTASDERNLSSRVPPISAAPSHPVADIINDSPSTPNWSPTQFEQAALVVFDLESEPTELDSDGLDEITDQQFDNLPLGNNYAVPLNPLDPYNIPQELKSILNYHLLEVAPKLVVDDAAARNPYSQFILQLAVEKPPLLYACAALAASHRHVRLSNESCKVDCLRFRGKAMRRLQEQLWSEQCAKDDGILTTILMLTLTDMSRGDPSNFDAHFNASKRLINLRGAKLTRDAFVEQYIAWLDIMCAANNKREALFTSEDIAHFTGPSGEWSHDVFPCPPDQFTIVSEVVRLYKSQPDPRNPAPEVIAKIEERKRQLLCLPMHTERGIGWFHLTEAFRHAIALYMIRLFHIEADPDEMVWLTQSVFYHSKLTPPFTGWTNHLLWPLFHAGLELRDERQKQWLRERSEVMQRSGGFRNVDTSMKILEQVWSSGCRPDHTDFLSPDSFNTMVFV
ncbi:uncharacterized protein PV07_04305 [Cladophialophora immunda]|uniref:Transcription factor domain-containing protein n=1 Tax=Cladophialophora immunda TaxID=569365 RepID=A0A0D2CNE1_9EURO|nr:uncharacterized protein PV07_04305 [Cladophialophora immunda]KIW32783.1 hypothetical protein PV07_04305 [Cladophialophora immunda]OQU95357.1 Fungal specific transcription factor domain-containing protein [Cladophialophora immunda]